MKSASSWIWTCPQAKTRAAIHCVSFTHMFEQVLSASQTDESHKWKFGRDKTDRDVWTQHQWGVHHKRSVKIGQWLQGGSSVLSWTAILSVQLNEQRCCQNLSNQQAFRKLNIDKHKRSRHCNQIKSKDKRISTQPSHKKHNVVQPDHKHLRFYNRKSSSIFLLSGQLSQRPSRVSLPTPRLGEQQPHS